MAVRRRKKKKNRFFKILLITLFAGTFYFFYQRNFAETNFDIPETVTSGSETPWWDSSYAYRRKINVSSKTQGYVEINHAQLNIENKSNSDGSDLKIVALEDKGYVVVPFTYNTLNSLQTRIYFDPNISNSDIFYIYYGNKGAELQNMDSNVQGLQNSQTQFILLDEESPLLKISSLKKWILKEKDIPKLNLLVSTDLNINSDNTYFLIDNNKKLNTLEISRGSVEIPLDSVKTGEHKLYLVSNINGNIYRSNNITFNLSAPVYVAWTLDWEGVEPQQQFLNMVADIAADYNIKLTHFFSPRILINVKIAPQRKRELVNWVLNRYNNLGEEIAMHLHMHHDMVEEAGVTAKYNAQTWDRGSTGFDTPSTEYNYFEYLKILRWGKAKMVEFGLPEPKGFRAGGWFANIDNLKAMKDAGFVYDSSGRVSFPIGQNRMTQPWQMTSRTQPYYISESDQNSSSKPSLGLLEIPNNGLDSYWSDAETLIQNFYDNYTPNSVLNKSVLVTYLSHPEWFNIDDPKLRTLFDELNKYRIDFDNGPVKFVTLSEWMDLNADMLKN